MTEEFLSLFQAKLFSEDELERIRLAGLTDPQNVNPSALAANCRSSSAILAICGGAYAAPGTQAMYATRLRLGTISFKSSICLGSKPNQASLANSNSLTKGSTLVARTDYDLLIVW
jgi:hypothetical protein